MFKVEREKEFTMQKPNPSQIDAYGAGYINKDLEKMVILQNRRLLKGRFSQMVVSEWWKDGLKAYGYELDADTKEIYTKI